LKKPELFSNSVIFQILIHGNRAGRAPSKAISAFKKPTQGAGFPLSLLFSGYHPQSMSGKSEPKHRLAGRSMPSAYYNVYAREHANRVSQIAFGLPQCHLNYNARVQARSKANPVDKQRTCRASSRQQYEEI
jgi:hypothetical protein